ncbi:MAG TPA: hypothetical protein VGV07_16095 [Devosia sp.]|jgi:hypothetical protein|uniref:hypothetical protein n=1 Tax=Devosia sp. TaxID=1871048 RepID=UPI002DDD0E6E|nr:hypothetical protein [Devosia sp.]HEV2516779.1 hypothetical protein [Devosia sp.]
MNIAGRWGASLVAACAIASGGILGAFLLLLARENPAELTQFAVFYCGGILVVAWAMVAAVYRVLGRRPAIALSLVLVGLTAFSLYAVHLNLGAISVGIAAIMAVLFWVVVVSTGSTAAGRLIGAAALAVIPLVPVLTQSNPPVPPEQVALLDRYAAIRLNERPNIYLIGFDAMIPREAASLLLDLAPLAYDESARDLGMSVEDNVFAAFTPSSESFDSLMTLDDKAAFPGDGYFAGRRPSPVATLFRANGYRVETGSSLPFYFGSAGAGVDEHIFPVKNLFSDSSLCRFASETARAYGTFGLCLLFSGSEPSLLFDESTDFSDPDVPLFDSVWHKMVLDRIVAAPDKPPKIGIYYYYYPIGHAPNDFDSFDPSQLAQYRHRFKVQADLAARVIHEIVAVVRERDPHAILAFFGDHGVKISRTINWKDDTAFWVRDNHAVFYAAARLGASCAVPDQSRSYREPTYTTLGRQVASIVRCLSSNPEVLDALANFTDKFDFSQYLLPKIE